MDAAFVKKLVGYPLIALAVAIVVPLLSLKPFLPAGLNPLAVFLGIMVPYTIMVLILEKTHKVGTYIKITSVVTAVLVLIFLLLYISPDEDCGMFICGKGLMLIGVFVLSLIIVPSMVLSVIAYKLLSNKKSDIALGIVAVFTVGMFAVYAVAQSGIGLSVEHEFSQEIPREQVVWPDGGNVHAQFDEFLIGIRTVKNYLPIPKIYTFTETGYCKGDWENWDASVFPKASSDYWVFGQSLLDDRGQLGGTYDYQRDFDQLFEGGKLVVPPFSNIRIGIFAPIIGNTSYERRYPEGSGMYVTGRPLGIDPVYDEGVPNCSVRIPIT